PPVKKPKAPTPKPKAPKPTKTVKPVKKLTTEKKIVKPKPLKASKSTAKNLDLARRDTVLNNPEVLSGLKVPKRLYHVTSKDNLKNIQAQGLKTAKKASSEGEILGTYLTDDPSDVILKQWDIKIPKDKIVVLEVDTAKLNLRVDPEYFYWDDVSKRGAKEYIQAVNAGEELLVLYSRGTVPSEALSLKGDPLKKK
ncbi:unnamed protein product, partial [marine sediment metagenome]